MVNRKGIRGEALLVSTIRKVKYKLPFMPN